MLGRGKEDLSERGNTDNAYLRPEETKSRTVRRMTAAMGISFVANRTKKEASRKHMARNTKVLMAMK